MALKRIRDFLLNDEINSNDITYKDIPGNYEIFKIRLVLSLLKYIYNQIYSKGIAVSIKNTDLGWDDKKPYLQKYFLNFF